MTRSGAPCPLASTPVEFGEFGRMVAARCPKELAHIVQGAGDVWEPGSRRLAEFWWGPLAIGILVGRRDRRLRCNGDGL
jgi:hypothetical protein